MFLENEIYAHWKSPPATLINMVSVWAIWQCLMGLVRLAAGAGSRSLDAVAPLDVNTPVTYPMSSVKPVARYYLVTW